MIAQHSADHLASKQKKCTRVTEHATFLWLTHHHRESNSHLASQQKMYKGDCTCDISLANPSITLNQTRPAKLKKTRPDPS